MKKMMLVTFMVYSLGVFSQEITNDKNTINSKVAANDFNESENKKQVLLEKQALPKPYDPKADAEKDIKDLVLKAKKEDKNIIIQAGGNWCIWCLRFNNYVKTTPELKEIIDKNYLYYHLNSSLENKNKKVFEHYGNPGDKYGYPVFIVLDKNGKMIHIQPSDVLEERKGYSLEKVKLFFNQWLPKKS